MLISRKWSASIIPRASGPGVTGAPALFGAHQAVHRPPIGNAGERVGQRELLQHGVLLLEQPIRLLQLPGALLDAFFKPLIELAEFLEQLLVALFQRRGLGRVLEDLQQLARPVGLEDVPMYLPGVDRVDGGLEAGRPGHHQANRVWRMLASPFQQLDPAHAGHQLVRENDVHLPLVQEFHCLPGRLGGEHLEVLPGQGHDGGKDLRLVIHHEQRALDGSHVRLSWGLAEEGEPGQATTVGCKNDIAHRRNKTRHWGNIDSQHPEVAWPGENGSPPNVTLDRSTPSGNGYFSRITLDVGIFGT